ncbi:MAG: hypothetical protein H7A03_10650 [Pseudomonadales bacterium]|nr:hypothetical protein [Pseudomonadales bacterium]
MNRTNIGLWAVGGLLILVINPLWTEYWLERASRQVDELIAQTEPTRNLASAHYQNVLGWLQRGGSKGEPCVNFTKWLSQDLVQLRADVAEISAYVPPLFAAIEGVELLQGKLNYWRNRTIGLQLRVQLTQAMVQRYCFDSAPRHA